MQPLSLDNLSSKHVSRRAAFGHADRCPGASDQYPAAGSQSNAQNACDSADLGVQDPTGFRQPGLQQSCRGAQPGGETNRLFIVEQGGRIWAITNLTAPTKTLFLDLSHHVLVGQVVGLFALTLHPGYETNGLFFVGYNLNTQTADTFSRAVRLWATSTSGW